MKLIDMLVEELPKNGGWDAKWHQCAQDGNGEVCFFTSGEIHFRGIFDAWSIPPDSVSRHDGKDRLELLLADDYSETIITREQYEAALAEKEHPLPWDEKNKPCPTLGAECRGCPDCGRRVSCTSDDITDDAVRTEMGMNSRALDAALAAKNDGWIEWGGGKHPPVSTNTVVDVKLEKGYVQSGYPAGEYSWEHIWQGSNIIAYRLHSTQGSEQAKADEEADLNECIGHYAAPIWNGEGLPPVGCVCERSWAGDKWLQCEIIFAGTEIVLVKLETREAAYRLSDVRFRPIRSEAERKRDEAVKTIMLTGWCQAAAEEIYDLVAAGKVPGMKVED